MSNFVLHLKGDMRQLTLMSQTSACPNSCLLGGSLTYNVFFKLPKLKSSPFLQDLHLNSLTHLQNLLVPLLASPPVVVFGAYGGM